MRVPQASRPQRRKPNASTAAAAPGNGASPDADTPGETKADTQRNRDAGRGRSRGRDAALRAVLRGLCAGDLECVLLTVAMAAEENRMPSADPDETARILDFLKRLARYDAALPPCSGDVGVGPESALGTGRRRCRKHTPPVGAAAG